MAKVAHVVGIDPGVVHTGIVEMLFEERTRTVKVAEYVVLGTDITKVSQFFQGRRPDRIFVERYKPRSNLDTDQQMVEFQGKLRTAVPRSEFILNTGVKQVVRQELMELLGVWQFRQRTHHQDLRSAARIALYGMLKDTELNALLTQVVTDHLDGRTWRVA